MIRIDDKALCCGCGACAQACPAGCIAMERDGEGFLYPAVDAKKCVNCGRCEAVCPILNADKGAFKRGDAYEDPFAAGGWNRDAAVRQASSSGGAFGLFADWILARGGVVFGAALKGLSPQHVAVYDAESLGQLRGSKYVQSAIGDSYRQVRQLLKEGRPVLFTGTPCQTAGLAAYIGKRDENLYLVDFICHGVPSPMVFSQYLESLERQRHSRIVAFSFREKDKGWHPSGLQLGTRVRFADGAEIRNYPALKDSYMNGFLEDIYLRPCCYECRFKTIPKHTADITIADFWGVDKALPEMNDGKGTSLVLVHNDHGMALFDSVKANFHHQECDWHKALRKNPTLLRSAKRTPAREQFFDDLKADGYDKTARKYMGTAKTVVKKASRMAGQIIENVILRVLTVLASLLHINLTDKMKAQALQFIKFCMVGVTNVIVSYTVNVITLFLLGRLVPGLRYDYVIANVAAFVVSVYWSFFWNSRKVFHLNTRDKSLRRKALFKSYLCYGFSGIVVNNILSAIWIEGLGVSKFVAPLLNLFVTIPLNFYTNKKFAFSGGDKGRSTGDTDNA